jgi:hypothetical protein
MCHTTIMSDFNYNQFPEDLLRHEKARIEQTIAYNEYRLHLIEKAIGKQTLELTTDFAPTLFTY